MLKQFPNVIFSHILSLSWFSFELTFTSSNYSNSFGNVGYSNAGTGTRITRSLFA